MNPYLDKNNNPTESLKNICSYYGITINELKQMSDDEVRVMVRSFSDVLNDGVVRKASNNPNRWNTGKPVLDPKKGWNNNSMVSNGEAVCGDSGSFSRYFSLDAWWAERIKELPVGVQKTFPFLIVPKSSKSEKNKGLAVNNIDNSDKYNGKFPCSKADKLKNVHPTVKPVKLMSYLITLGSRKGDVVLDPFSGSGSTLVAGVLLGRIMIGIELSEEYCEIIKARWDYWSNFSSYEAGMKYKKSKREESKKQLGLFDGG